MTPATNPPQQEYRITEQEIQHIENRIQKLEAGEPISVTFIRVRSRPIASHAPSRDKSFPDSYHHQTLIDGMII